LEHDGCSLCISQLQPSIAEIALSLPVGGTFVAEVIANSGHCYTRSSCEAYRTRAPPSCICPKS
jgi:hypothetical protein